MDGTITRVRIRLGDKDIKTKHIKQLESINDFFGLVFTWLELAESALNSAVSCTIITFSK
jgi:hypothetical protein